MSDRPRALLSAVAWITLGGWIGAMLLFGLVVAPAAFRVLPAPELAGSIVRAVLPSLNVFGAAAGVLLAGLAILLGRSYAAILLPLAMSTACLWTQLWIAPRLEELRARIVPGGSDTAAALGFAALHRQSVRLFVLVGICALVLAGLHLRAELAQKKGEIS